MKTILYNPLKLRCRVYTDVAEYVNCEYKPFGEITQEMLDGFAGWGEGDCTGFITKEANPNILVYIGSEATLTDIQLLIAHKLGHLRPRIDVWFNDENKADSYERFVADVLNVSDLIYRSL